MLGNILEELLRKIKVHRGSIFILELEWERVWLYLEYLFLSFFIWGLAFRIILFLLEIFPLIEVLLSIYSICGCWALISIASSNIKLVIDSPFTSKIITIQLLQRCLDWQDSILPFS